MLKSTVKNSLPSNPQVKYFSKIISFKCKQSTTPYVFNDHSCSNIIYSCFCATTLLDYIRGLVCQSCMKTNTRTKNYQKNQKWCRHSLGQQQLVCKSQRSQLVKPVAEVRRPY